MKLRKPANKFFLNLVLFLLFGTLSEVFAFAGTTTDWCKHLRLGQLDQSGSHNQSSHSERPEPVDVLTQTNPRAQIDPIALSRAHIFRRFFGVTEKYSTIDQALAEMLVKQISHLDSKDLENYAKALPDTCWLPNSESKKIGPLKVGFKKEFGPNILFLTPGVGKLEIPKNIESIIVDFSDLPNVAELRPILFDILGELVTEDVFFPEKVIRNHKGMTDEYFTDKGIFRNFLNAQRSQVLKKTGSFKGQVFLLTGLKMTPEAVEIAIALRLSNQVRIVGNPLITSVAETYLVPVGEGGLVFRYADLYKENSRVPDVLPVDLSVLLPKEILKLVNAKISQPLDTTKTRPEITVVKPYRDIQNPKFGHGDLRAAVLIAHGASRLFYPNFETVGDRIDERLTEILNSISDKTSLQPGNQRRILRRFSESLSDGHSFVFNQPKDSAIAGYLPLVIETIQSRIFVRRSAVNGIASGDEILSVGGVSVTQFYREQLPLVSASTSGYKFDIANRELLKLTGPTEIRIFQFATKKVQTLNVSPEAIEKLTALKPGTPELRPSGWLADLQEPDTYFLNLSMDVLRNVDDFRRLLTEATKNSKLKKIILDMRGYPGIDVYEIASRFICKTFQSPQLRGRSYLAPNKEESFMQKNSVEPRKEPHYCGTLAILVGAHTVSAAEHLAMMLVDANRVRVYGDSGSAGSNGNIPGIQLPGGLAFTFSGVEVRHANGERFVGVGIRPRVKIPVRPVDFALKTDSVLEYAIKSGDDAASLQNH